MEKNHEILSPKFNLHHLFTLVVMMMMSVGLSHNSHVDQAGRLRALRCAKRQARSFSDDDQEWTMLSLEGGEELSFNGGKMEDDLIAGGLPGQPSGLRFKQYGGYVNVDGSNGRSLFYYFAEAVKDPSSKPLLLWLNGGPLSLSLSHTHRYGVCILILQWHHVDDMSARLFLTWNGCYGRDWTFRVNPDGKSLYSRRYSWNKVANVLFLESPAGVGFSYSNTSSDYSTSGDKRTALDTYNFLINWFRRYPHYKASDFYIAGESYAGFYIPELADIIVNRSREADSTSKIQLKGILVGNGIMNDPTDLKGCFDYLWNHALISDQTYHGLLDHCLKSKISKMCEDYEGRVETEVGNIDFYNIYSSVCPHNSSNSSVRRKARGFGGYDPCEGDYVHMYLNLPQVQQAFHANITKLPYTWELCSDVILSWKDSPSTMFPIYRRLIATGLRILLYSGDTDAVVPVSGTRYAIDALNLTVTKAWHPWSDDSHDVSGYTVVYEGLTFTTVRGAGHQVPQCQPCRAFALFKNFVMGN